MAWMGSCSKEEQHSVANQSSAILQSIQNATLPVLRSSNPKQALYAGDA